MVVENYVGIDVSKLSFDVFVREIYTHKQFKNESVGFELFVKWLIKQVGHSLDTVLICFEHTGLYSLPLAMFLEAQQIPFAMVPALEIKRSLGITRGKNDRIDSKRIAEFAYRFSDKISTTRLPATDIRKIHSLLTLRDRLITNMKGYAVSRNEMLRVMQKEDFPVLFSSYENAIISLQAEINNMEQAIKAIIKENEQLRRTFELITTIKGIGFVIASFLIVYTYNFTRFDNWRKFACYSGIAPFEFQSGTSVYGKTQVSSIANQQVKRMLHLAAMTAIHFDTELREYYIRRQADGKSKMAIINIIRNKLVARVFAVVKRGTPFVDIKRYAVG
ncbi:IS110 family transposase [Alistipes sp.]|uniref:IS110 family transposase n=1 Tax=Alistipes sp. TaxID=1872444 RepID=UPI003AF02B14